MDFENLRAYIEKADIVGKNIFLINKPKKIKADSYIVYNFRETNGGKTIRDYQIDLRIISPNVLSVIDIKEKLINLLDFYNRPCDIEGIRVMKMLDGGGLALNEETGEYNCFLYFSAKI